jgi:drug/metabolite transporter (DMT)-like permease
MQVAPPIKVAGARYTRHLRQISERGWVLALFSVFAFSFAPPVARFAIVDGFNSTALLLIRTLIATGLLAVTLIATDHRQLRLPWSGVRAATLVGAVNAMGMITFFLALNYLEASLGAMILALSPPIVLTLLALRGERLSPIDLFRLFLALVGVYLLVGPTGLVDWMGAALALVATFLFALQSALTQWTLLGYPTRSVVFYVTASMTLFILIWWWIRGSIWSPPGVSGWVAVLILAVVSTYLARLAYYGAVRRIGSGQLALLGPVETMLSVLWSILFLDEHLSPLQVVGGVLILVSALLAVSRLRRVSLRLPRR